MEDMRVTVGEDIILKYFHLFVSYRISFDGVFEERVSRAFR